MKVMRTDLYTKIVLTAIAALLAMLVLKPLTTPATVQAQSDAPKFYFEPGYTTIRKPDGSMQVQGKVAIDLRTGSIYGFPTLVPGPYPVDSTDSKPPVSQPVYLGRFNLSAIKANP